MSKKLPITDVTNIGIITVTPDQDDTLIRFNIILHGNLNDSESIVAVINKSAWTRVQSQVKNEILSRRANIVKYLPVVQFIHNITRNDPANKIEYIAPTTANGIFMLQLGDFGLLPDRTLYIHGGCIIISINEWDIIHNTGKFAVILTGKEFDNWRGTLVNELNPGTVSRVFQIDTKRKKDI